MTIKSSRFLSHLGLEHKLPVANYNFIQFFTWVWNFGEECEVPSLVSSVGYESIVQMSNEKKAPGCLGSIGDYTTQLNGENNKPL